MTVLVCFIIMVMLVLLVFASVVLSQLYMCSTRGVGGKALLSTVEHVSILLRIPRFILIFSLYLLSW